ncbi:MAG: methyltransferase domain-containing protein [Candidatus Rokubacteria bacterium]|nr:methyltransferase domain-containing protein [Candidatus Rokubacteria bacterium]
MDEHGKHDRHGDRHGHADRHAGHGPSTPVHQRGAHGHGQPGHGHHNGAYRNPEDLDAYVKRQLDPARAEWQKPDRVLRTLGLRRGAVVADIGAGAGFWVLKLARAVGREGHVYAVEPEPQLIAVLRERLTTARMSNVSPVLGRDDDPMLPAGVCDVVLIVNTYHHFPDGPAFLRKVARLLRRGGAIVNIDFAKRETPVGPPVEHRVAREDFLRDARRAGLRLVAEHDFLPHQYFLVLKPSRVR